MENEPDRWRVLSSRTIAECRVFDVREDLAERTSDGKEARFFVLENPDWVNVIAKTTDGDVVMIRQFRHGTGDVALELPGGMIDEGEEHEAAARRELQEETGYSSEQWTLLGRSHPNPALQDNVIYHYLAENCTPTSAVSFDEHESVVTDLMPLEQAKRFIMEGKVNHSLVVAAFYYLDRRAK